MADHYQILGVAPTASVAEIRKVYMSLARDKHPDRFPDPEQKRAAEAFFRDATSAFNVLTNERARREYDQQREKPRASAPEDLAAEAFTQGVQFFEGRQYGEAVELFRIAAHHMPSEARYHAALGRALSKHPQWAREAAEALEEALRLAPRQIDTYVALARLYLERGMKLRARKVVETGLRVSPQDRHLLALSAQAADEPPSTDGGGGLRGMLKRKS
jgi:DnaJ-class molecular chaperone